MTPQTPPETTTRRKRTPLLLRLSSLSLSPSLSLSLYARPCVSKKKERESPSALKHTLFPLASSTSSIEKKREGPREREREREGRTLFFIFFWPFENSFVFCPFSKKRERVRLSPPFFECAVVFFSSSPYKTTCS